MSTPSDGNGPAGTGARSGTPSPLTSPETLRPTSPGSASPSAVVVVGASAGGVDALQSLITGLPPGLPAAVLVVLHLPPGSPSALPAILSRCGTLPARHAVDGDALTPGQVLVAPPDRHLLVVAGRVRLSHGPAENGHRPAVDPLFRSAARAFGDRVVAIIMSGARDDGAAGAVAVARHGGTVLVQDPTEALHNSMPSTARQHVASARALPAAAMGAAVAELVGSPDGDGPPARRSDDALLMTETAVADLGNVSAEQLGGVPAGFGCPACHGSLFELPGEPAPRFRCRIGHAWSPDSLLDEQASALEGALWMALRSLEEKAALSRRMAESARRRGGFGTAERYESASVENEQAGRIIRDLVDRLDKVIGASARESLA